MQKEFDGEQFAVAYIFWQREKKRALMSFNEKKISSTGSESDHCWHTHWSMWCSVI